MIRLIHSGSCCHLTPFLLLHSLHRCFPRDLVHAIKLLSTPVRSLPFPFLLFGFLLAAATVQSAPADYFGIQVIDEATGRGVPLITLKTTSNLTFVTDSAGWIAVNEPGLMDVETFFQVSGPGYSIPKDGFGYAGVKLTPKAGETTEVKVTRSNIAERLYRITGQGIYRDSTLLGRETLLPKANLNAGVTGQDSVQAVPWKGRIFWLWGDTNIVGYPLGVFQSTCAWSDTPENGGLDPAEGIHLEYFKNVEGQLRKMVPIDAPGPVWLFGLLAVSDSTGREHLLGHYNRMKDLTTSLEQGLAEFNEKAGHFVPIIQLGPEFEWQYPRGNAVRARGREGDYFYFTHPLCVTRVKAEYDALQNPSSYEALTWSAEKKDYIWQSKEAPLTQEREAALVEDGKIPAEKARLQLKDVHTGKRVLIHGASVQWNAFRQRWVMIGLQNRGEQSLLGEVWYAEAESVSGPWKKAIKIASHPKYTFYNPRHHAFFDQKDGRFIYFEGTYTETFSGNPVATPLYDYNQILYRLDLEDPRLKELGQ